MVPVISLQDLKPDQKSPELVEATFALNAELFKYGRRDIHAADFGLSEVVDVLRSEPHVVEVTGDVDQLGLESDFIVVFKMSVDHVLSAGV